MIGYKYRANIIDENSVSRDINSLLNDELWASSLSNLNDPFEAVYKDNISKYLKLLEKNLKAETGLVQKNWDDLMAFNNKIGFYSLALSKNEFPDNELMWAHYANSHKGFCIAYDIKQLEFSEERPYNVNEMQVVYKLNPPIIDILNILNKDFLVKMFGTKSNIWEYENELRLIYNGFGLKKYNPFSLKSVYFGLNMDEKYQKQIIDGLSNRDINFYKMSMEKESYKLTPNFLCSNERIICNKLSPSTYEIITKNHNFGVENFHVLYKEEVINMETMKQFISKFREQFATREANIYVYDSMDIRDLINKSQSHRLYGKEEKLMSEHLLALSIYDIPDEILMYPNKTS